MKEHSKKSNESKCKDHGKRTFLAYPRMSKEVNVEEVECTREIKIGEKFRKRAEGRSR